MFLKDRFKIDNQLASSDSKRSNVKFISAISHASVEWARLPGNDQWPKPMTSTKPAPIARFSAFTCYILRLPLAYKAIDHFTVDSLSEKGYLKGNQDISLFCKTALVILHLTDDKWLLKIAPKAVIKAL